MAKSTVKKLLQSMTKAEIIEMALELYSARKEAKECAKNTRICKFIAAAFVGLEK